MLNQRCGEMAPGFKDVNHEFGVMQITLNPAFLSFCLYCAYNNKYEYRF